MVHTLLHIQSRYLIMYPHSDGWLLEKHFFSWVTQIRNRQLFGSLVWNQIEWTPPTDIQPKQVRQYLHLHEDNVRCAYVGSSLVDVTKLNKLEDVIFTYLF